MSETAEDIAAQAEFDQGAANVSGAEPQAKAPVVADPVDRPVVEPQPDPEPLPPKLRYARITEEELAELRESAKKTGTFEKQFAKAFGTIGDVQKIVRDMQSQTPRGIKVEVPEGAFEGFDREGFPEMGALVREAIEKALTGVKGTASSDISFGSEDVKRILLEEKMEHEAEVLDDLHPDWREIVGAIDASKEPSDPDNKYRQWLAAKPEKYQAKINSSISSAVMARSITLFQKETSPPPAPAPTSSPQTQQRAKRIEDAIQPRGDGGHPGTREAENDEFVAAFNRIRR